VRTLLYNKTAAIKEIFSFIIVYIAVLRTALIGPHKFNKTKIKEMYKSCRILAAY